MMIDGRGAWARRVDHVHVRLRPPLPPTAALKSAPAHRPATQRTPSPRRYFRPAAKTRRCRQAASCTRRQVFVDRPGPLLRHQIHAAALSDHDRDIRRRVAEIAEVPGVGRTGAHAGRHPVDLGDRLVVDAVDAQRAFLHHAGGEIHLAGAVRAGPGAQSAADAFVLVDQHDAVGRALVGGAGRADGDAGRVVAMQAGFREMHDAGLAGLADDLATLRHHLECVDAVQPGAGDVGAVGVLVGQRRSIAAGVPFLAAHHAGMTADTDVEVDDQAEFFGRRLRRQQRHLAHSWP